MGTISLSLPSDGNTIDASDVNTPFNTISAVINGNLDDDNIITGANINGTKLLANSVPPTSYDVNARAGWNNGIITVMPTVTALGNRSYSLVHATTDLTGYLSPGMRLKLTRTVTAPTQCTSLNGTTQYYSKSSPAGMTFTDDFTVSAWVKLSSYASGVVMSRYSANGWLLRVDASGRLVIYGEGTGVAKSYTSYQSVPLNKWTHVAASLDMSASSGLTYIDGTLVPSFVTGAATVLVQAGTLTVGALGSAAEPFPGKIAQAAVFSAVLSAATIRSYMSQTLSGSETSLISAYSFNNSINDLNANANNLTPNGSAVATSTDSPFSVDSFGNTLGTTDYAIVTSSTFSTNTTLVVQVPEANAIPTTGGVSAMSYSQMKAPYGMPINKNKYKIWQIIRAQIVQASPTSGTWYNPNSQLTINAPVGAGTLRAYGDIYANRASGVNTTFLTIAATAGNTEDDRLYTSHGESSPTTDSTHKHIAEREIDISSATPYYVNFKTTGTSITTMIMRGDLSKALIEWELAYL